MLNLFHVFINKFLFIETVTKVKFVIFHPYNYEHFVNSLNREPRMMGNGDRMSTGYDKATAAA